MSSLEVLTLESFELWSTKALKSFLALRRKSTEGGFKELASRQVYFKRCYYLYFLVFKFGQ